MQNVDDVVRQDLDYICDSLADEFGQMAGSNLLIVGGAGFLGYYLVQAVLHWNERSTAGEPIRVTVFDNFIRGVPTWLDGPRGRRRTSRSSQHDITDPLPADIDDFQYIIHARVDRLADVLPAVPDRDDGRERQRPAHPARVRARRRPTPASPVEGFLFYSSQRDLRRPDAREHPDAGDLPRQRLVHRTARLLRRVEALRRDAVRELRAAARRARSKMARPFNNYGPGLKITDRPRASPISLATCFAGRDIVMLSDGSPTRTFCYVGRRGRRLLQGARQRRRPARPTTSASRRPRSRSRSSPSASRRSAASCSATSGKVVREQCRRTPTTSSTTRTAAARSSPRRGRSSATTRDRRSTKGCAAR